MLSFKLGAGRIAQPPENHSGSCKIGLLGRDYGWLSKMLRSEKRFVIAEKFAAAEKRTSAAEAVC